MALEEQSQEDRDRFQQEILRRIQQKKMKYSAMEIDNNVMMNDIIKEEELEVTTIANFISILKEQLSNSLQLSLSESSATGEEETLTTQLPPREEPRSLGLPRSHRLNRVGPEDRVKSSSRLPKSSSSILAARASLVRKSPPPSISSREKRINVRRLMYDPRRKVGVRRGEK